MMKFSGSSIVKKNTGEPKTSIRHLNHLLTLLN